MESEKQAKDTDIADLKKVKEQTMDLLNSVTAEKKEVEERVKRQEEEVGKLAARVRDKQEEWA